MDRFRLARHSWANRLWRGARAIAAASAIAGLLSACAGLGSGGSFPTSRPLPGAGSGPSTVAGNMGVVTPYGTPGTPGTPGSTAGTTAGAVVPIIFVHGNGDTAALWSTVIWRFESNGWPRSHLLAVDMPRPLARDDYDRAQPGRSGPDDQSAYLADQVNAMLRRTGANQVALVGNSRGGYAIRHYIRYGGGASKVSHVVLGGVPNHGIWANEFRLKSEFNGAGPFLRELNSPQGPQGLEVTPGPQWLTLRSQGNDKFAQPDGRWIGQPTLRTGVTEAGPMLKGAKNVVLGALDHREVSYHAEAFAATFAFIAGQPARQAGIVPEPEVTLDGVVTGFEGAAPTNLPLPGARVEVYALNAATGERRGAALQDRTVGGDGRWGPVRISPATALEFVISAEGFATTHLYRSPFPRSSDIVNLRPRRLTDADRAAGSIVLMDRPRGYFDLQRYRMHLDGKPLVGVTYGVAGISSARVNLPAAPQRAVVAQFERERIVARNWPAAANHVTIAELND